jgi:hypothetical protein
VRIASIRLTILASSRTQRMPRGWRLSCVAVLVRLDAYRQAFEAFIHSFTTYRPLLLRIKSQYDAALDDALESAQENIHMRCDAP